MEAMRHYKTKWISIKSVAVHVDNGRDSGDKVGSLTFKTGKTLDDLTARTLIEVKGPDNTVRLRQAESQNIQQSNCEMETLRVFRPITSQVFGKLLEPESEVDSALPETWEGHSGTDLKEHVVGTLPGPNSVICRTLTGSKVGRTYLAQQTYSILEVPGRSAHCCPSPGVATCPTYENCQHSLCVQPRTKGLHYSYCRQSSVRA